jgi:hypothetical protein
MTRNETRNAPCFALHDLHCQQVNQLKPFIYGMVPYQKQFMYNVLRLTSSGQLLSEKQSAFLSRIWHDYENLINDPKKKSPDANAGGNERKE